MENGFGKLRLFDIHGYNKELQTGVQPNHYKFLTDAPDLVRYFYGETNDDCGQNRESMHSLADYDFISNELQRLITKTALTNESLETNDPIIKSHKQIMSLIAWLNKKINRETGFRSVDTVLDSHSEVTIETLKRLKAIYAQIFQLLMHFYNKKFNQGDKSMFLQLFQTVIMLSKPFFSKSSKQFATLFELFSDCALSIDSY